MWLFHNKSDFLKRMLIGIDYEIQRALVERSPMIYRRTNHQNRKKEGVATALYISYLGQEYILTVAHTFQDYDFNSLFIDIVDIPLSDFKKGCIIYPPQKCNFKANDYCFLFVDDNMRSRLQEFFCPMPIHPDAKRGKIIEEMYFVLGYPATKNFGWAQPANKEKIKTFRYCLHLPRENNNIYPENIIDYQKNIILKYKKRVIPSENIFSRIRWLPPKLNGMRGCGIWTVVPYPLDINYKSKIIVDGTTINIPPDYFITPHFSLQGMLTNYDKSKQRIIGFAIQNIIEAIEHINKCQCIQNTNAIITSNDCPDLFF